MTIISQIRKVGLGDAEQLPKDTEQASLEATPKPLFYSEAISFLEEGVSGLRN